MANVDIRLGHKNTAWFTTNSTLVLKDGQMVVCSDGANRGKYKIGDGVTQLSALTFYGGTGYTFTGTTSQYTRGDGTYATFPTNVSSFTNDSGYLTASALTPYLTGLTIGSTAIASGTNTRILYNNAGVLGEYLVTGTGTTAVLSTSPTINTPTINGFTLFQSTGTPLSGEPNYFVSTINTITGNQYNIRSTYTVNSINNNSAFRIGGVLGETYIHASNTGQLGFAVGTYGYIQNYGTGLITRAIGSYNIVANRANGNIVNTYGGYFKTENDGTGIITLNAGAYIETPSNPSGIITINSGIYIAPQNGIGVTNYSLYSAGASDLARFEGSLTVQTAITSSTVTFTPLITGTTVNGVTYKGTSLNPTLTDAAHLFTGGNNGVTEIIRFLNNGNIRIPNNRVIQGMDSAGTYRDLFTWSGGDNILINGRPGVSDITINPSTGVGLVIKSTGDAGIGVATPGARWEVRKNAQQLRLSFDASNHANFNVTSVGRMDLSMTGADPSIQLLNNSSHKFGIWGATPVVRPSGWATPTGTLTRTTFNSGTATLGQVAERLAALITDINTIGLIGT